MINKNEVPLSVEELKNEVNRLKTKLDDSFLLSFDTEELFSSFNSELIKIDERFISVFNSFESNVISTISIAKLPIEMSFERTIKLMVDDIYRREQILSVKELIVDDDTDSEKIPSSEELHQRSMTTATNEFNLKLKTESGQFEFWYHTLKFIKACTSSNTSEGFLSSSKDLINQATLLTWSYLEILLRDFFITYLNTFPDCVGNLAKDPGLRSKFDLKSIPIERLVENKYDLSNSMGNLLIDNFDFSNIDVIKSIYKAIFADDELSKSLKDVEIWRLYNRRNLIVHRGGVIDKKYLDKTGDSLGRGIKLFIKPHELKSYIVSATLIGTQLIKASQSSKTK